MAATATSLVPFIARRARTRYLNTARLKAELQSAGSALLFGLRLWASICLTMYIAFCLQLEPSWAGTAAAIVCQPTLGASLRKSWFRLVGTIIGAIAIVVLTAWFPQNRALFFVSLAPWGGACAFVSTVLRSPCPLALRPSGQQRSIDEVRRKGRLQQRFIACVRELVERGRRLDRGMPLRVGHCACNDKVVDFTASAKAGVAASIAACRLGAFCMLLL